jgi:hypothetical protein
VKQGHPARRLSSRGPAGYRTHRSMATLYVTDLDGTLIRDDLTLSREVIGTNNEDSVVRAIRQHWSGKAGR